MHHSDLRGNSKFQLGQWNGSITFVWHHATTVIRHSVLGVDPPTLPKGWKRHPGGLQPLGNDRGLLQGRSDAAHGGGSGSSRRAGGGAVWTATRGPGRVRGGR
ncbi:MAG: hypothetical protein ACK55I_29850, partial [bacterium]